jgi:hypothetical protein
VAKRHPDLLFDPDTDTDPDPDFVRFPLSFSFRERRPSGARPRRVTWMGWFGSHSFLD